MSRLGKSFAVASASLALFGLGRVIFNLAGVRVFGPVVIGDLNVAISMWSLIAVVIGTVPSFVVSKYVSEFLAVSERDRAARVLAVSVIGTSGLLCIVMVASTLIPARTSSWPWPFYGVAFGTYLVCRAGCFAHQQVRTAFQGEAAGFVAFGTLLVMGLVARSVPIAAMALIAQPLIFCMRAIWGFRRDLRLQGAVSEIRADLRRYALFSGATFVNATTGMASYHLVIVLAGHLTSDSANVGYLSVLLSTLSPVNLVPLALGSVLYPEFARRHGVKDLDGNRRIAFRATCLLQLFVITVMGSLLVLAPWVFQAVHVPPTNALTTAWFWLVYTLGLSIVSSPCGHLLNATEHAPRQAIASSVFLIIGVIVGVLGLPARGIIAAGWMRFGVDGGLAWTRMAIAERMDRWIGGRWPDLVVFQLAFVAIFLECLTFLGQGTRLMTLAAATLALVYAARADAKPLIAWVREGPR
jgi:O-antigen/teichoic acid export membrane protein